MVVGALLRNKIKVHCNMPEIKRVTYFPKLMSLNIFSYW
jgi:hypothetical protein